MILKSSSLNFIHSPPKYMYNNFKHIFYIARFLLEILIRKIPIREEIKVNNTTMLILVSMSVKYCGVVCPFGCFITNYSAFNFLFFVYFMKHGRIFIGWNI